MSQADAARELGVTRQWVSKLAGEQRLSFKPSRSEVPQDKLEMLARRGLTRTEAARHLGTSPQRVGDLAAKLGLSFTSAVWGRPKAAATELGRVLQETRLAKGYSYARLAERSGDGWFIRR